jgi:hypothetical protein
LLPEAEEDLRMQKRQLKAQPVIQSRIETTHRNYKSLQEFRLRQAKMRTWARHHHQRWQKQQQWLQILMYSCSKYSGKLRLSKIKAWLENTTG